MRSPALKRLVDIVLAAVALLLLALPMAVIALLVRTKLGSPVIFRQERPGLDGRPFMMMKFRSMTNQKDESGNLLPDAQRLTKFGRLLRASSLDELPEIFNVLKGEMSLVGPRPLLMQYLERYDDRQRRRHEVRPGITGYAQINGRNTLSWEDKFELDVWYVENWTIWLDFKIMLATVFKVIRREGVSAAGEATAKEFMGSDPNRKTTEGTNS